MKLLLLIFCFVLPHNGFAQSQNTATIPFVKDLDSNLVRIVKYYLKKGPKRSCLNSDNYFISVMIFENPTKVSYSQLIYLDSLYPKNVFPGGYNGFGYLVTVNLDIKEGRFNGIKIRTNEPQELKSIFLAKIDGFDVIIHSYLRIEMPISGEFTFRDWGEHKASTDHCSSYYLMRFQLNESGIILLKDELLYNYYKDPHNGNY